MGKRWICSRGLSPWIPLVFGVLIACPVLADPNLLAGSPSDTDVRLIRTFPRQLLPVDEPPAVKGLNRLLGRKQVPKAAEAKQAENSALADTMRKMAQSRDAVETTDLDSFLKLHPDSRWAPALRLERGHRNFQKGFFKRATADWDQLWEQHKDSLEPGAIAMADEALARLLESSIGEGNAERIAQLLGEQECRPGNGALEPIIWRARKVEWLLKHIPAQNVMCGPLALYAIMQHDAIPFDPILLNQISADMIATGISLAQIKEYADHFGLKYQAAKRGDADTIPVPSVMHHQTDHYSAIVEFKDGMYFVEDGAMQFRGWVSPEAISEMASGYFLIPAGVLPPGWSSVTEDEAKTVFGRDGMHGQAPTQVATSINTPMDGGDKQCGGGKGMPVYTFHPQVASLRIDDEPLGYSPPVGPAIRFRISYNDYDDSKPVSAPNYPNVGRIWNTWWVSFVTHVPGTLSGSSQLKVYLSGGGTEVSTYDTGAKRFGPNDQSFAYVRRYGAATSAYERVLPDGTREIFNAQDNPSAPTRVFLSQRIDPQGNAVNFAYDGNMRLVSVADAIGQVTTLSYTNADIWKITRVTDPFGRFCTLSYNAAGELETVTDMIGLMSRFRYDSAQFVTNLVTPYGTTTFAKVSGSSWDRQLTVTDPQGDRERVEYAEPITIPDGFVGLTPPASVRVGNSNVSFIAENARMANRNSFYWNKMAMREAPGDRSKAKNYRWYTDINWRIVPVIEAIKEPLEERVWFNYPGSSANGASGGWPCYTGGGQQPTKTLRFLDSGGTVQLEQRYYNRMGNTTLAVDPLGRRTSYLYASNEVDLLEIRQAVGSTNVVLAQFSYNSQHMPTNVVDIAGQTNILVYNARGQLLTSTNPKGEMITNIYDANGYLLSVDRALPGTVDTTTFTYDGFGRVRTVTEPDGYVLTYDYDAMDRITRITYPDASYEEMTYDKLDLVAIRDRIGRLSRRQYNALRQLTSVTDPLNRTIRTEWCDCGSISGLVDAMGRRTLWNHDIQGRLTDKVYADGSRVAYEYDLISGRLQTKINERGFYKFIVYNVDNSIRSITYPNSTNTGSVYYEYDPYFSRMTSMMDTIGTTTYSYVSTGQFGGGQIASVNGPWATNALVSYAYDQLGRITNRSINAHAQAIIYDEAGRMTSISNTLGLFKYTYVTGMPRVASVAFPNGQSTHYVYRPSMEDRRVSEVLHQKPDMATLAHYAYGYNGIGNITNWSQQVEAAALRVWDYGYDDANQLISSALRQLGSMVHSYVWRYDPAGNRLLETFDGTNRIFSYNSLNQLVHSSDEGTANVDYEWDAEERLIAITEGGVRTVFGYDGAGHRVSIHKSDDSLNVRLLWCETEICELQDAVSNITMRRYYEQGFTTNATSRGLFFYTRDHLRSVRLVTDSDGTIVNRSEYDPWGQRLDGLGEPLSDFGFGNYWQLRQREVLLAEHRPYSPRNGAWLSRDPVGIIGGLNLYAFCGNNPVNIVDPFGLSGTLTIYADPGDGSFLSGHAWISYQPDDGSKSHTYSTWRGNSEMEDRIGESERSGVSTSRYIDDATEAKLFKAIDKVKDKGLDSWKWYSPCSDFASDMWNLTGKNIRDRNLWGISNPNTLAKSINKLNDSNRDSGGSSCGSSSGDGGHDE